jgi:hypothetical protein
VLVMWSGGCLVSAVVVLLCDLHDESSVEQARLLRNLWGRRLTEIHLLDEASATVALVLVSGGPRWSVWEARRREWIMIHLSELAKPERSEAA